MDGKKEVRKMATISLKNLEKRIKNTKSRNADKIKAFESKLEKRNLRSGRVRPKDPTEAKILERFKRK